MILTPRLRLWQAVSCPVPVACIHHRSHISSLILFKPSRDIVWIKILLEFENRPIGHKNSRVEKESFVVQTFYLSQLSFGTEEGFL